MQFHEQKTIANDKSNLDATTDTTNERGSLLGFQSSLGIRVLSFRLPPIDIEKKEREKKITKRTVYDERAVDERY